MQITLKGYKVNFQTAYKIVNITPCCDEILRNPVIVLNSSENEDDIPEICLAKHYCEHSYEDYNDGYDYYPIKRCPYCGQKFEIRISEIEDVTLQYDEIQKQADECYKKANKSDSKSKEQKYREQGHEISKKLNWWLSDDDLPICRGNGE